MRPIDIPFNIYILNLTAAKLANMKPVTVLDSTDGATSDFHPNGLFSTEIFYKVGDRRRETTFSYIDIKLSIFHPLIYNAIVKMKRFYADIMSCKKYAKWNEQTKDFELTTPVDGRTGMHFFIEHWLEINFAETGSTQREQFIMLLKKYRETALTSNIAVLPAGLRDMEVDDTGRKNEDEINTFYRKFLAISNSISNSSVTNNPEIVDKARFEMQKNFNLLYDTLENMVKGKKKLFSGSMVGRRIQNGTRNVITAGNSSVRKLGEPGNPTFNSTIMGLYQFSQAIAPVTIHHVRELIRDIFLDVNQPANLIDPKTLLNKPIQLPAKIYDRWGTNEGLRKTIAEYREESVRDVPIKISGNYLALMYEGPDNTFCLFGSIDQLPKDKDKKHVRPATLTDLLYIALYKDSNTFPVFVTRYPVVGIGSIYPSMVHLRVTAKYEKRRRLDAGWNDMGNEWVAIEYPVRGSGFVNSLIPHTSHLSRLEAD